MKEIEDKIHPEKNDKIKPNVSIVEKIRRWIVEILKVLEAAANGFH